MVWCKPADTFKLETIKNADTSWWLDCQQTHIKPDAMAAGFLMAQKRRPAFRKPPDRDMLLLNQVKCFPFTIFKAHIENNSTNTPIKTHSQCDTNYTQV